MFDTMVFTKIVGAFCGALLVFLLGQWAADELYKTSRPGMEQAYVIDTGDDEDAEPEVERSFAELLQVADASAGSRQWNQCRACHVMAEGEHGVGPSLYKVVGRDIASIDGFNYSGALPDGVWTTEEMSAFIEAPREYAPGTSMGYSGMASAEDRANLIAYIIDESGDELADFVEAAAEEAPAEEPATEEGPATEGEATEEAAADDAADTSEEAAQVEEAATEEAMPEDGSEFAQLVASFGPDDGGARLWNQCRACHALEDGQNRVGPHLFGVVGREVGSVEGFNYSGALSDAADVWDYDALSSLLEDPREYAPGTTMAYAGMSDAEDRAKLIAYIEAEAQ